MPVKVLEIIGKAAFLAALWVGIWALLGSEQDRLATVGVISFGAYAIGFWHGRYP